LIEPKIQDPNVPFKMRREWEY